MPAFDDVANGQAVLPANHPLPISESNQDTNLSGLATVQELVRDGIMSQLGPNNDWLKAHMKKVIYVVSTSRECRTWLVSLRDEEARKMLDAIQAVQYIFVDIITRSHV